MTSPAEPAGDHSMASEDDQNVRRGLDLHPAAVIMTGNPQSPAPSASVDSGDIAAGSAAAEPDAAGGANAERQLAVSAPGADLDSAHASPAAKGSTTPGARWQQIQLMFVDDPRSSVELAAGLVDDRAEALAASVRERQHALLSAWQGDDAGTEELRIALQQYRAFWNRLEDFCL
jgi:hypothetical protein